LVLLTVGDLNFPALTMRMAFVILRSFHEHGSWTVRASSDNISASLPSSPPVQRPAAAASCRPSQCGLAPLLWRQGPLSSPARRKGGGGGSPLTAGVGRLVFGFAHGLCPCVRGFSDLTPKPTPALLPSTPIPFSPALQPMETSPATAVVRRRSPLPQVQSAPKFKAPLVASARHSVFSCAPSQEEPRSTMHTAMPAVVA
jgi:hypothetical protein